jgi:hypothetical protein
MQLRRKCKARAFTVQTNFNFFVIVSFENRLIPYLLPNQSVEIFSAKASEKNTGQPFHLVASFTFAEYDSSKMCFTCSTLSYCANLKFYWVQIDKYQP